MSIFRYIRSSSIKIAVGGNISSSSLNQGYLGLELPKFTGVPWRVAADINFGRFYTGFNGYFRRIFL
jgi:hypothetical protein